MIAGLALALGLFEGGARAIQGATPPPGLSLSAESCGACHVRELAAWRRSRHAAAYDNAIFAASFAREPRRWCLYCHAPLPEQVAQAGALRRIVAGQAPLADEGVGCAACHVRDGVVLGVRAPSAAALAAHPTRQTPVLAQADACAGCHQFDFPREDLASIVYTDEPMQDTVAEWRRAGAAAPCQACHMPDGAHTFSGGHDVERLRGAVEIDVRRRGDGVRVTLRAPGTPHRTPTGDPFRRLVVELCEDVACARPLARPWFGRAFRRVDERWRLWRDTSIPAGGEVSRTIAIAGVRGWRLSYAYAAPSSEVDLAEAERAVVLRSGAIDAPTSTTPRAPGTAARTRSSP